MIKKINIKIWSERLSRKIRELEHLTKRARSELLLSAADHFLRAAGKQTPQTAKKSRGVEKSTNNRDWILWCSPRTSLKPIGFVSTFSKNNKYRAFVFRKASEAKSYKKIKNRGLGKMGWWVALSKLKTNTVLPRGYNSEVKNVAERFSNVSINRFFITLTNRVRGINRYGALAYAKALRSTAKWMNANVVRLKKTMKKTFNGAGA